LKELPAQKTGLVTERVSMDRAHLGASLPERGVNYAPSTQERSVVPMSPWGKGLRENYVPFVGQTDACKI
jgi:hypothetical protein